MKIGIDCRLWNETGLGRYIRNIVKGLAKIDSENEYVLFVLSSDSHEINLPSNFTKVEVNIRWYSFLEQIILPFIYYSQKLDLLFVPNLNVPIFYFKKFVVTIHDLTVLKIKTGRASTHFYLFYLLKRLAVNIPLWYGVKFSKAVFTVSQFVKQDIKNRYKIKDEKIYITSNAVSKKFHPVAQNIVAEVLAKYKVKRPYLFYVGNAHPHKNLEKLIEAFNLLTKNRAFSDLSLVLGGKKNYFYERLEHEISQKEVANRIVFPGFIDDHDLSAMYTGAEAFVTASLHEGFGIQILEAFACETKVICSKTTSLPEVGGNIAYYFDPKNITSIAETIKSCLQDTSDTRIKAGLNRVNDFSWERSTKVIYETCTSI